MEATNKSQFEKELNERLDMTIRTIFENEKWQEIFSHLSQAKIVETISIIFLSTNIKKGSEQAFVKAFMALRKR